MVEIKNKFILSDDKAYVDNVAKNRIIQINNANDKIKEINKNLMDSWEIYKKNLLNKSVLKKGNLVECTDIDGDVDRYVCYDVIIYIYDTNSKVLINSCSNDYIDPDKCTIEYVYRFWKMRKNSEKSFNKTSYSNDMFTDIKIVDQSKNYLLNDDIELF